MLSKKWLGLFILFAGVSTGWAQMNSSLFPQTTGMHEQILQIKDFEFRYTIAIPDSYSKNEAVPLILSLHYGFDPKSPFPPYYGRGLLEGLMTPALAELDAIIVAPDSHGKRWNDPKIENALLELIAEIKKQYRIDQKKILLIGYSMGGIGTWHMVASHPHLFSAAIPIASMPSSDSLDKITSFPLYVMHGQNDQLFSVDELSKKIEKLRKKGSPIEFEILQGTTHYETSKFIQPLKNAIPWIKEMWKQSN